MTSPIIQDLILTPSHKYIAMKWHDVLKESSSPDSFKENYLSALCVSSAAGGEIESTLSGLSPCHPFLELLGITNNQLLIKPLPGS